MTFSQVILLDYMYILSVYFSLSQSSLTFPWHFIVV